MRPHSNPCPIGHDGCKHYPDCANAYNNNVTSFGDVNGCWYAHGDYSSYNGLENISRVAMLRLLDNFDDNGRFAIHREVTIPRLLGIAVAAQIGYDYATPDALDWLGFQVYNQYERCFNHGSSPHFAWLDDGLTPDMLRRLIQPFVDEAML